MPDLFPGSLARRIRRLERAIQPDQKAQWRVYLERRFTGPEYDGHRAAILDALVSDVPRYHFTVGEVYYLIDWIDRKQPPWLIPLDAALAAAL